jgi:membrane protease YdiL (CAAX protease family)
VSEQRPSTDSAIAVVAAIVAVEYLARHLVAPAIPTIGEERVNDMLVTGVAYVALSLAVARSVGAHGVGRAITGVLAAARRWEAWVGGLVALVAAFGLGLVDAALWGKVVLPAFWLPGRSTTWLVSWARWLVPVSLLAVNGVLVPVAEEWLWRGVVQPRFTRAIGTAVGVAVTAVCFSLKHALVDASLGRLLAITAAGAILGVVALRASWKVSALSHVVMNTVATGLMVASTFATPTCLAQEPPLDPDLVVARARALELIDARDPGQIEALFAPDFLDVVGMSEVLDVYARVHDGHGHCTWRCTIRADGTRAVEGALSCTKSPAYMKIAIEPDPPHKVDFLVIVPFAQEIPAGD